MKGDFWSSVMRVLPVLTVSLTCSNREWIPTFTIRCAIVLHDSSIIIANEYIKPLVHVSIDVSNSLVLALHSSTLFNFF